MEQNHSHGNGLGIISGKDFVELDADPRVFRQAQCEQKYHVDQNDEKS